MSQTENLIKSAYDILAWIKEVAARPASQLTPELYDQLVERLNQLETIQQALAQEETDVDAEEALMQAIIASPFEPLIARFKARAQEELQRPPAPTPTGRLS